MEATLRNHLQLCAQSYGAARKLGLSTIGRRFAGDARFFSRLDQGKTFTIRKYDDLIAAFWRDWPEGRAWPRGVPKPASAARAAR